MTIALHALNLAVLIAALAIGVAPLPAFAVFGAAFTPLWLASSATEQADSPARYRRRSSTSCARSS